MALNPANLVKKDFSSRKQENLIVSLALRKNQLMGLGLRMKHSVWVSS
jgi:hypothetical protein